MGNDLKHGSACDCGRSDPDVIYLQPKCCAGDEGQIWADDDCFTGECENNCATTSYTKTSTVAAKIEAANARGNLLAIRGDNHLAMAERYATEIASLNKKLAAAEKLISVFMEFKFLREDWKVKAAVDAYNLANKTED